MAVSVSPKKTGVGPYLRRARRTRRLDLDTIATQTRINARFLAALEADEPPSSFPGPVYARAFLREYALFLGLDPEPLVGRYREAHEQEDTFEPMALPRPVQRRSRGRLAQALLVIISLGVVSWLSFLAVRDDGAVELPAAPDQAAEIESGTDAAPEVEPPPAAPQPPAAKGVRLEIRVKGEPAWVRVGSGEGILAQGTKEPGWSRTFEHGKRLNLEAGNAGAVRLIVNGERRGAPGESGEIYRASFVWKDGEVRVEPLPD